MTPSGKTSFGDYLQLLYCESFDLSIFHDGEEIALTSGASTGMQVTRNADDSTELSFLQSSIKFDVPDNVSGIITLQFENLNGSDLADAIFSVVIDRVNIDETSIPAWIKNNAGWWATDQIDDSSFLQGIQYLVQKGIIVV